MIVYLHGFNSSPASGKAKQLSEHMARLGRQADYYCPALPNSPREAIALVETSMVKHRGPVTLVGNATIEVYQGERAVFSTPYPLGATP